MSPVDDVRIVKRDSLRTNHVCLPLIEGSVHMSTQALPGVPMDMSPWGPIEVARHSIFGYRTLTLTPSNYRLARIMKRTLSHSPIYSPLDGTVSS
jgi:hypothetical protein